MPFARKLQVSMNTPSLAGLRLQSQLLNKMTESTYSYAVFVQCQDHFFIPLVLRTLLKIKSLVFCRLGTVAQRGPGHAVQTTYMPIRITFLEELVLVIFEKNIKLYICVQLCVMCTVSYFAFEWMDYMNQLSLGNSWETMSCKSLYEFLNKFMLTWPAPLPGMVRLAHQLHLPASK